MIKRADELQKYEKCVRSGPGVYQITLLADREELRNQASELTKAVIQPGCGSGFHAHEKNCEICYILEGELEAHDDDTVTTVKAGDVTVTKDGHSHCLINRTDRPATIISLII